MLFFGLVRQKANAVEAQSDAPDTLSIEPIAPVVPVANSEELVKLCTRMLELEKIWITRAKDFPLKSPLYNEYMELARQIRDIYQKCLDFYLQSDNDAEILAAIRQADQAITALVEPEINKRFLGEKPIHRIIRQQAEKPEEEKKHKAKLDRLIAEGAKVTSKTRVYRRSFWQVLKDVFREFPSIRKMIKAYKHNPARSVFDISQFDTSLSTDFLQKIAHDQGIVVPQPNPISPLTVIIFSRVKNVINYFSSPGKLWVEKLSASSPVARLISLHEELMGQKHLQQVHQYLIEKDRTIIGEFFRIISDYKRTTDPLRLQRINVGLERFFGQLGISNIADVFLNIETVLTEEELKNSLEIQILFYLLAYVYKFLNVSKDGKIIARYERDYDQQIEKCLKLLEKVDFSSAYIMHTGLNTVDDKKIQELNLKGAFLGNRQCQYALCEKYFSFLTSNLSVANPPEFVFPPEITHELLIAWAIKTRELGYTNGLANMQNFMDNFFGAAGALYQEGVSPAQKERIQKIGEVVKAISGDKIIDEFVNTILALKAGDKTIHEQYKAIRESATQYLTNVYTDQFKRTNQSVEVLLDSALMQNMFERHAVFQMLSHIEQELKNEEARLKAKHSETAQAYTFPLRRIQELKQDLMTETEDLGYLHRNDPNQVMKEAEITLGNLYRAIKNNKEISSNHILSVKSIKHKFGKCVNAVLPESLAVKVQPSSAVKSSYNLYQAAKRINAGKSTTMISLESPRRVSSKKLKLGLGQHDS